MDISVIVTNYNYGKLIKRCLRSLLNQDLSNTKFEVIIVDDCSTDNSFQNIKNFENKKNFRIIRNKKNLGVGAASQIGLENAIGKYFVRVDSDDYVQPPFLYMLYNFLKFNSEFIGVSCDYYITNNEEKIISIKKFKSNYIACGLMFRTSYLENIGSYNKKKRIFEDRDLFKRVDKKKIFNLPLPLYNYVKHGNSLTSKK
jgi:glycosyltransferase involved in cell wall biosynthesis